MRWIFREKPPERAPAQWAEDLEITPLLLELLWRRGFRDYNAMEAFLSAKLADLSHPSEWPAIPEAASLLAEELLAGKKAAIWGDYDTDGITATTLALEVLEHHGFSPLYHLPDRRKEGYGLNIAGIEELAGQGCQLLLTVDCGISDIAAVQRARELGMTVIVSDHHLPGASLPPANAIVDPRMPGNWPCASLAGVGVAFFLMAAVNFALAEKTGNRFGMAKVLDLVSLGTLADVMQLDGQNRILARAGLNRMEKTHRPGVAALKKIAGMDAAGAINSDQALFRLVPRLNAAGRMGSPNLALDLLRAKDFAAAEQLAAELDGQNCERKSVEKAIYEQALAQAEELLAKRDYSALALVGEDWHPGIVGIVASRIVDHFNRPAFVLCKDGDSLKGSGRSVADFDLHGALCQISDCLIGFGGHRQAAGARLSADKLEEFRENFHQAAFAAFGATPPEPELLLEGVLDFAKASNHEFLRELELLQPFGPGNEEPVFASPPLNVKRRSLLGHSGDHAMLLVCDETSNITLAAKGWRMAAALPPSLTGKNIRLAYIPRIDSYNGIPRVDLEIKDWRLM